MSDKMKNLITRSITGVFFVAAVVTCFLRPEAMIFLFALVTGLTVWEFTGIVNNVENVTTNRALCTVAGVYFFISIAGFCSGIVPSAVFIPYLLTVVYLFIAELYTKAPNPINNWAYTMLSPLRYRHSHVGADVYSPAILDDKCAGIPRCCRRCGLQLFDAVEHIHLLVDQRHGCLSERFALWQTQAVSARFAGKELGRKYRRRHIGACGCSSDRMV